MRMWGMLSPLFSCAVTLQQLFTYTNIAYRILPYLRVATVLKLRL